MSRPTAPGEPSRAAAVRSPGTPDASRPAEVASTGSGSRLPSIAGHQPALDGLRALAAFAVLVIHVGGVTGLEFNGSPLSWAISRGDIGVPIFFALSGFLLYRPWAMTALCGSQAPAVGRYLWRRALRILPAYWLVVVLAFLTLDRGTAHPPQHWAQYLFLAQTYDPHPWWSGTGAPGLEQMWSLAVEASFYLVLPVVAAGLTWIAVRHGADVDRRGRWLLAGIGLLGASSYGLMVLAYYPAPELWLLGTLPRLMTWFAAGMAIAVVAVWAHAEQRADGPARRLCRTVGTSAGKCWLVGALAFAVACTSLAGPVTLAVPSLSQTEARTALYAVVAVALLAPAALQPPGRTRQTVVLGNPVMRFLGRVSYGIFLWQFLVLDAFLAVFHLHDVFHGGSYTLSTAADLLLVITLLTVAVATVSYYVVERPAQRLYNARWPRSPGRYLRPREG